MDANIYKFFLKHIEQTATTIDRLIVSAYLNFHSINVLNNSLIKNHIIDEKRDIQEQVLLEELVLIIRDNHEHFDFEDLIELFEFVISPSDKIVNGAVYTPKYIRDYIVEQTIKQSGKNINKVTGFDPSCGCGGFLLSLSKYLKDKTNNTFAKIYSQQIYGCDITQYSVNRAMLLLALQAISLGEDAEFKFNFTTQNSLVFNFRQHWKEIEKKQGFDLVVGNPPYVASRNMDEETLRLSQLLAVSQSGHPDLYIPFFQIGIEQLNATGHLGYITVNTFMKSINGRALRQYFQDEAINLTIINFGGEQVFDERNTYTCICVISKINPGISYFRTTSSKLDEITRKSFRHYSYTDLDHRSGWNLANSEILATFIKKIESTGKPFDSLYKTKNGIATLKNKSYKFVPIRTDHRCHYLKNDFGIFPIEVGICRNIVNANKLRSTEDLERIREKIIYPYRRLENGNLEIISPSDMKKKYPLAYTYLKTQKTILATRDKDKAESLYEQWYAYGRRQSMDNYTVKLFFPHICERPNFVLCEEPDLLFYNGIAVVADEQDKLVLLKKILESNLFYQYMKATTKDYASGYISMSRNYLKKFGVPVLNATEINEILQCIDVNPLLEQLYNVSKEMKVIDNNSFP